MIHDNFLKNYDLLREFADSAEFKDEENPVDGVIYPMICAELPDEITKEVQEKVKPNNTFVLFMRMSPEGVHCPHIAHTDNSMGDFSLMIYLNRQEHCKGGTSLIYHRQTGMAFAPEAPEMVGIARRDQNISDAWITHSHCAMAPNRAFNFPAQMFHRAEPIGGFGTTNHDSRLVLTCFYD